MGPYKTTEIPWKTMQWYGGIFPLLIHKQWNLSSRLSRYSEALVSHAWAARSGRPDVQGTVPSLAIIEIARLGSRSAPLAAQAQALLEVAQHGKLHGIQQGPGWRPVDGLLIHDIIQFRYSFVSACSNSNATSVATSNMLFCCAGDNRITLLKPISSSRNVQNKVWSLFNVCDYNKFSKLVD